MILVPWCRRAQIVEGKLEKTKAALTETRGELEVKKVDLEAHKHLVQEQSKTEGALWH